MTTPHYALHSSPVQVYFHNLGRATLSLGAALIAAELPAAAESPAAVSAWPYDETAHGAEAAASLNALASTFDATQPNQAAELRWLASRG
jgi:hypothetical protein